MTLIERQQERVRNYREILPHINGHNLLVYFGGKYWVCDIVKDTAKTITVQVPSGESNGKLCQGHRAAFRKRDLNRGKTVYRRKYGEGYEFRFGVASFRRDVQCAIRLLDPRERRQHREELQLQREQEEREQIQRQRQLNYNPVIRWQDAGF